MLINRNNLRELFLGLKTVVSLAYAQAKPQWNQVAMLVPSSTAEELYTWLGKFPNFRQWVGDRVLQNIAGEAYRLKNVPFENTVSLDRDEIDDDSYGLSKPLFEMLGLSAANHPDELVFAALAAGHTSLCYDGQFFFDNDHPVLPAGGGAAVATANDLGGGGTKWFLLCADKPLKPLIFQRRKDYQFVPMDAETDEAVFSRRQYRYGYDARVAAGYGLWQMGIRSGQTLDEANYALARAAMMAFKSDGGQPLNFIPTLLVVPPSLESAAKKLLEAEFNANGATNVYRGTAKLLVTPFLS